MCLPRSDSVSKGRTSNPPSISENEKKAAFQATRLTSHTFLIKEHTDIYNERPHIYTKIVPKANTILIIDTGCGGASTEPDVHITGLRKFIETVGLSDNEGKAINEGGLMKYVVVTTHCHYDHILAVEDFSDSPILASAHSPSFLAPSALPKHSLCTALNIKTPSYKPILVPDQYIIVSSPINSDIQPVSLNVRILHTPGHTPDELALYDEEEAMLYVGDTLYEKDPIIFPNEGSIVEWFSSIKDIIKFVEVKNRTLGKGDLKEVMINAGHCTALQPASEVLLAAEAFMRDVIAGRERLRDRMTIRGVEFVVYRQDSGRFSLRCPEKLVFEARDTIGVKTVKLSMDT